MGCLNSKGTSAHEPNEPNNNNAQPPAKSREHSDAPRIPPEEQRVVADNHSLPRVDAGDQGGSGDIFDTYEVGLFDCHKCACGLCGFRSDVSKGTHASCVVSPPRRVGAFFLFGDWPVRFLLDHALPFHDKFPTERGQCTHSRWLSLFMLSFSNTFLVQRGARTRCLFHRQVSH